MNIKNIILLILISSIGLFQSCSNEDERELKEVQAYLDDFLAATDQNQLALELQVIDDSLEIWGLTDQVLIEPNGVRYIIHEQGTGQKPVLNNTIRIKYVGKLLSSAVEFDSSESLDLILYALIAGFQTSLPLIPEGSVFTLYIPSVYGYGAQDVKDQSGNVLIPKKSNLIFDIEFHDIL
jgi:FKBP-type peptidyl-prolyl cis-trans isomerase